ncbi:MFS transporter [Nocardioides sp.]|uniref:MFS transporter n=1 Tax=Nocardioides sp. TaxID=35761 RepID=UPI002CE94C80|nr:MFS transporter [Nocardioides sp.]HXH81164.1 MFS transporter [Nocardioides sp.]
MLSTRLPRLLPRGYQLIFANRSFSAVLPAIAASDMGDGMSMVAIVWLALQIVPQEAAGPFIGAAVAAYVLPGAVGALLFSRWLRRLPARRLLRANAWVRAVFLGCVPLAWTVGVLEPALYLALLAGSSLLHGWGGGAKYALVSELLPADEHLAGNALLSTSGWASTIGGPVLAGGLTVVISPAWIVGLDALSFVFLAIQTGRVPESKASASSLDSGPLRDGWRILAARPELLGLLALTWFFNFFYGPVRVALTLFVGEDLRGGASLLGLYWAVFGIGAVAGALAIGAVRRLPMWPVMICIVAGHGLAMLPFALPAPAVVSLLGFAFGGLVYGPYSALAFTRFQAVTPASWLTTVLALRSALLLTASPIGAALGGPLTVAAGPRSVLAGTGVAMIILALLATALCVLKSKSIAPQRPSELPPLAAPNASCKAMPLFGSRGSRMCSQCPKGGY